VVFKGKPIRLMVGLLLLKQLENLSDERVVLQFKRNPYYQYFCGYSNYSVGQVMFFSDAVVSINTLDFWACLPCKATLISRVVVNQTTIGSRQRRSPNKFIGDVLSFNAL
jgi:hypothetical protein